jgi:hypothetical protein
MNYLILISFNYSISPFQFLSFLIFSFPFLFILLYILLCFFIYIFIYLFLLNSWLFNIKLWIFNIQYWDVDSTISGTVNFSLRIMKKYWFFRRGPFNDTYFSMKFLSLNLHLNIDSVFL